ncbi:MAG: SOS response-associated peptidase, partial [Salinibacterium sp.]|nr:SOS response-associated peptidase [Salinibacterium sp.]
TRASTGALADIHDRMPVLLSRSLIDEWLDSGQRGSSGLLDTAARGAIDVAQELGHYEVDRAVGSVRNNSPALIEPVAG